MEAFESVDSDVDADADKQELAAEEEQLHSHHHGMTFGVHKDGEKDTPTKREKVDPMDAVHHHRLGEEPAKVKKAAPVAVKKVATKAPSKASHSLKDLLGGDEEETPKPAAKPQQKKPEQKKNVMNATKPANKTEAVVSSEVVAQVEKMKADRLKEKAAAKVPKKVTAPVQAAPKKPHSLGKDLESISAQSVAPLDKEVVAKLEQALPAKKKKAAPVAKVAHEHEHGDAIGRLHAHAKDAKMTTATQTTTVQAAPRKASAQQLAAARRASALTDALRNVNASEVELNLDASEEDAKRIRDIESKKEAEAEKVEKESKAMAESKDHMEDLRATAEKTLEAKVHQLETKSAKKAAAKKEHKVVSKLAEALGINDEEAAAMTTTSTAAPAKKAAAVAAVDPIKALHQAAQKLQPKKEVEKPKAAPAVQPKKDEDEPEEGIMAGLHHNKARDSLPPVLR